MSAATTPVNTSLDDFAPRVNTTCGACLLPEDVRKEVENARLQDPKRFTYSVISKWLLANEMDLHPDALRRHFNRHVEGA
jgi:hypothetical protein